MHNIKGTNIVALAIPKLCTVIDTPRARYDMLQRESFVLQQYAEKSQWTDAEEILLDDGCWLTFASWNNMEHIFLSRHEQNKYASEAGFSRERDGFTNWASCHKVRWNSWILSHVLLARRSSCKYFWKNTSEIPRQSVGMELDPGIEDTTVSRRDHVRIALRLCI